MDLVPTMEFIHEGHGSLIERFVKKNDKKRNVTELSEKMYNLVLTLLYETHILELIENNEL